ncbi:integrase/recombinase xerD homolog [Branchiostoma lanceolatum]|uniref:integrase/recombinase xerD homolog n=1 Tax=Branchiostoma lanceolatum TaxID=7740 RepID=UPI003455C9D3
MAEFDFEKWAESSKLTPATIKALAKADLAEKDALLCVTAEMLQLLDLSVGQYALLCRATKLLQTAGGTPKPKAKVTLEDLKTDKELADLLGQIEGSDDLLGATPTEKVDEQAFYLQTAAKQGILDSEASLDADIRLYRSGTYADSTKATYKSQRRAYLRFCLYHQYVPVPVTTKNLCRYAVFLARTLKYNSIVNYLNIVRVLHQEAGLANPLHDNWLLQTTLRGIRRIHGDCVTQKLPITPDILRAMYLQLDFTQAKHVVFWAACLVGFFSFFRKSNLLPKTAKTFDPVKHLCRKDFRFFEWGAVITVRWSKTIQFRERTLQIPIPRVNGSPLCPTAALEKAFALTHAANRDGPAFVLPQETGTRYVPLTHQPFVTLLRHLLHLCGYPKTQYSGHSLRRGGATWASDCGIPAELIKLQGDWKSNAYQRYTTVTLKGRLWTVRTMAKALV